jgi:hypothetical protein
MASRQFSRLTKTIMIATPLAAICASAFAHGDSRKVGDGRISDEPRKGYLYSCQQSFNPNAPGADDPGDWIDGNRVYPDLKPTVNGRVKWSNARISIKVAGGDRVVSANNLPTHRTGKFPIQSNDDAYEYDRNPNAIEAQKILLRLPANPAIAKKASCVPMGMIGFTLKGAAIYNALDAAGRDAPAYEIQDKWGGHPQEAGQYHYHDLAAGLPDGFDGHGHSELIGYALDGFGIYGEYEKKTSKKTKEMNYKKLDECHGHVGKVMWDGKRVKMYHYHMTFGYPYSIGCFRGTPVSVD